MNEVLREALPKNESEELAMDNAEAFYHFWTYGEYETLPGGEWYAKLLGALSYESHVQEGGQP